MEKVTGSLGDFIKLHHAVLAMMSHLRNNQTIIFSGSMLTQQLTWKRFSNLLPYNSCLIVINPSNPKLAQTMRSVAKAFLDKGRPVHIWMSPKHA